MRIHNATCWCVMAFLFEVFCRRWPNVTSGAIEISKYWYPLILELNSSFQIHLNLHFYILHVNWVGWEMFQKSFGTQVFLCCKLSLIEVETCKDKSHFKMNQIWGRKKPWPLKLSHLSNKCMVGEMWASIVSNPSSHMSSSLQKCHMR